MLRRGEHRDGESEGVEGGRVEIVPASHAAQVRGCPGGTREVGQPVGAAFAGRDVAAAADCPGPVQEAEQGVLDRGCPTAGQVDRGASAIVRGAWNRGSASTSLSSGCHRHARFTAVALEKMLPCVSSTAFGWPVVPEV